MCVLAADFLNSAPSPSAMRVKRQDLDAVPLDYTVCPYLRMLSLAFFVMSSLLGTTRKSSGNVTVKPTK
jgi:hypothetical protein